MVIYGPTAVSDLILEVTAALDISLGQNVVADVTSGFALSGQSTHPFQLPIFHSVIAVIFDVIPNAKDAGEKLGSRFIRIENTVALASELDPP